MESLVEDSQTLGVRNESKSHQSDCGKEPCWFASIFLAFQHCLVIIAPVFFTITILSKDSLCILNGDPGLGRLASTLIFLSGFTSVLQLYLGIRLPILQTFSWFHVILIFKQFPQEICPSQAELYAMGAGNRSAVWQEKIREIQGSLIIYSITEIILGYSGAISFISRFVTLVCFASTTTVYGFYLLPEWNLAYFENISISLIFSTVALLILFSQILRPVRLALPQYSLSDGWKLVKRKIFQQFSVLMTIFLVTVSYFVALKYVDISGKKFELEFFDNVSWFNLPYPFQWGWPIFSYKVILPVLSSIFFHLVISLTNYQACANLCGVQSPPKNALNRGFGIEGVSHLISAMFGGFGLTTSVQSLGLLGVTNTPSRKVLITTSLLLITFSAFPRVCYWFLYIPSSVEEGLSLFCTFSIIALGVSYLAKSSRREGIIFAVSVSLGLLVKKLFFDLTKDPESEKYLLLIWHPTFVTFCVSFIFDYIIPKEKKERLELGNRKIYNLPNILKRQ